MFLGVFDERYLLHRLKISLLFTLPFFLCVFFFFVIGNIWLSLIANTYKHVILTYTHLNKYFWLFAIIFKFILSHLKYWPGLDFIQFISKEICLLIESGGSFIFYVLWHFESLLFSLLISRSYKYYATHNRRATAIEIILPTTNKFWII